MWRNRNKVMLFIESLHSSVALPTWPLTGVFQWYLVVTTPGFNLPFTVGLLCRFVYLRSHFHPPPWSGSALQMTPAVHGILKPHCLWSLSSFFLRGGILKHQLAACVGSAVVPTAFVSELIVQRCLCVAEVVRTERTSLPAAGHSASQ